MADPLYRQKAGPSRDPFAESDRPIFPKRDPSAAEAVQGGGMTGGATEGAALERGLLDALVKAIMSPEGQRLMQGGPPPWQGRAYEGIAGPSGTPNEAERELMIRQSGRLTNPTELERQMMLQQVGPPRR